MFLLTQVCLYFMRSTSTLQWLYVCGLCHWPPKPSTVSNFKDIFFFQRKRSPELTEKISATFHLKSSDKKTKPKNHYNLWDSAQNFLEAFKDLRTNENTCSLLLSGAGSCGADLWTSGLPGEFGRRCHCHRPAGGGADVHSAVVFWLVGWLVCWFVCLFVCLLFLSFCVFWGFFFDLWCFLALGTQLQKLRLR